VAIQHHRARSPAHRESTVQLMAELYIRAQVTVERGYRRPLTLATAAHSLAISPRQLERAYDEIGLTTFAAHLRAVRLRNAAELLAHQPLTVTDVARLVGYRQPSHFVKAFRRRFGLTPGAFRDAAHRDASVVAAAAQAGRPRSQSSRGAGPTVRPYSKPNSVDASWSDAAGGVRGADDVVDADCAPALAARADGLDAEDGAGAEPSVPPAPSKPSPLA
jgi:AraC-like DNA-binding protein